VRRAFILIVAVGFLAACGSSGSKPKVNGIPVTFGVEGGNIAPYTIAISAAGAVKETAGILSVTKHHVPAAVTLAVKADSAGVSSRQCAGTLPDIGARFVTVNGKTVTVHGGCEPAFEKLWSKLTAAVGIG